MYGPSPINRRRNAVIQRLVEINRRAKPKPKPKLKPIAFQSLFHKHPPPTPLAPRKRSPPNPKALSP